MSRYVHLFFETISDLCVADSKPVHVAVTGTRSPLPPRTATTLFPAAATARVGGHTRAAWTETTPLTTRRYGNTTLEATPEVGWKKLIFERLDQCRHSLSDPSVQLYEQILAENEKLKAQLRDTDLELADLKLQLEKATQVRRAPGATAN